MTLLQIISIIKKIALSQPNIHSFCGEFLDLNSVDAKYSAIVLQQRTHRKNNGFMVYSFYLGAVDRLTEDKKNEEEIQSTAIQVIDSIVYSLENKGIDCTIGSYNVFSQRFLAECAGSYSELDITVPQGECEDDFAEEKLDTTITANGEYNFIPKGLGFQSVHLNVDVAHLQDKSLNITKNGNYKVQYDKGFSGLGSVDLNVNVPTTEIKNQTKDELITVNNKRYTYTPDKDYTGIGELNVMVQIPEQPIYEEGYVVGKEDGINEQKRKLTDINITQNGTYEKEDGYKSVVVNVPVPVINNQEKSITITENGQTDITPDTDYTGLSRVGVNVNIDTQSYYDNGYSQGKNDGINEQKSKLEDISITENGTYTKEDGYKSVVVNVPTTEINNQEKSITITENGTSSITPDPDYTGLSKVGVVVNVPSDKKPETELTKTLAANDTYTYTPEDGNVYNKVIITTDIHPKDRLERTYVENGQYLIDGEYKDGVININVPTSGGGEFDLTSLGYTAQENTNINTDIQDSIAYSQSLLENYTDDTKYEHDSYMMFAPLFPCGNRRNFDSFFSKCGSLTSIPLLDFSKGSTFKHTFWDCCGLREIPLLDFSKGDDFTATFASCNSLQKLPLLDFSNGQIFDNTFSGCANLQTFPPINVSNGINFDFFLQDCLSLTHVFALDTRRSTTFRFMFWGDAKLTTIDELNFSNGQDFTQAFDRCTELTDITFVGSINKSIYFDHSTKLSYNSIKSILTACSKTTNSNLKTVSFNRTIQDKNQELTNLVTSCTENGWRIQGLTIN